MNIANATYRTPGWTAETEHFPHIVGEALQAPQMKVLYINM